MAEILMLRELLCRERNVLFILPYVSIVQEKVSAMSPFAIDLDFLVEEYTAGKGKCPPQPRRKRRSLFIASIEKGAVLMDSLIDVERPHEIGLVVVDELHLIGERGRGATLEAFLTKVMFLNGNFLKNFNFFTCNYLVYFFSQHTNCGYECHDWKSKRNICLSECGCLHKGLSSRGTEGVYKMWP